SPQPRLHPRPFPHTGRHVDNDNGATSAKHKHMTPWLIVVTGRPAAGKTTLAMRLGRALALPVFGKDRLKEVLFDQLGWQDREWSKKLGAASAELLYECAAIQLEAGRSFILENAFHPDWATPKLLALKARYQADSLEIQC